MADESEIRYLGDVQRLALAPDDIIVLKMRLPVSMEQGERIREHIRRVTGDSRKVLLLDDGIEIGVLAPELAN